MLQGDIDIRDAFFDEIYNIGSRNRDMVFITADADAFSLRRFKKDMPDQFINIGVAEQNMITVAAGLALSGKKVFIYAIIPFITLRCYEHIKVNICSMNLPVSVIGAGAGLSFGYDGPTHHAIQDIAVMRTLPEIAIFNLSDPVMAQKSASIAYEANKPVYIRLDKGSIPRVYKSDAMFSEGFSLLKRGEDLCIVSTGIMVHRAVEVAERLSKININAGVLDLYRIKPVNEKLLLDTLNGFKYIVALEENSIIGGIGTIMSEIIADNRQPFALRRIAIKDEQSFHYGTREWLHGIYHIDTESVVEQITRFLIN